MVQYAEEGTVLWEEETDEIQLQIVDNVVYASIKDIYDVERRLIKDHGTEHTNNPLWNINDPYSEMWWPIQQIYCISMISQTCAFFDSAWVILGMSPNPVLPDSFILQPALCMEK